MFIDDFISAIIFVHGLDKQSDHKARILHSHLGLCFSGHSVQTGSSIFKRIRFLCLTDRFAKCQKSKIKNSNRCFIPSAERRSLSSNSWSFYLFDNLCLLHRHPGLKISCQLHWQPLFSAWYSLQKWKLWEKRSLSFCRF